MKIAVVLPLLSEQCLDEYLGINLLVQALKREYLVDCIDLNELLVDYILSKKQVLKKLADFNKKKICESPQIEFFNIFIKNISNLHNADELKKKDIYRNFIERVVKGHFELNVSAEKFKAELCNKLLKSNPILNDFLNKIAKNLIESKYNSILISVPHPNQFTHAMLFCRKLKSLNNNIKIILGGTTITLMKDEFMNNLVNKKFYDYYIKFSGENKISNLIKKIKQGRKGYQVDLSKKEFEDINKQIIDYLPKLNGKTRLIRIPYSVGCYWGKCSFCDYINMAPDKIIRKKKEVLLGELKKFSNKGYLVWLVADSLLPYEAKMIAESIIQSKIKIIWGSFLRVNTGFDKSLFALLKKSGGLLFTVGLESVNDKVLKFLNKGYKRKDIYKFFRGAKEAHYTFAQVNFIYGTPVANLKDELNNIKFIYEFKEIIYDISFFPLTITSTSLLGQNLKKYGIQLNKVKKFGNFEKLNAMPFNPHLNKNQINHIENSYKLASKYLKLRRIKIIAKRLKKKKKEKIIVEGAVLFKQGKTCYLGSMKTNVLKAISEDFFNFLSNSSRFLVNALSEDEVVTLIELKLIKNINSICDSKLCFSLEN